MVENETNNNINKIIDHVVEIELTDQNSFSRIAEVLTRIGIPSYKNNKLYQTAHILHKRHHYYIVHFKDMFVLDGKSSTLDSQDIDRVKTIAKLLEKWGLCKIIDQQSVRDAHNTSILVIPRSQLHQWTLVSKYAIGNHHSKSTEI